MSNNVLPLDGSGNVKVAEQGADQPSATNQTTIIEKLDAILGSGSPTTGLAELLEELRTQQTDALTDAQLRASDVSITLNGETVDLSEATITPVSVTATTAGTAAVVTPAAGKAIRLWWWHVNASPDNSATVVASLKFASNTAFVNVPLSQYGGVMAHSYKSGRAYYQGAADEALNIETDVNGTVYVNVDYEEVTP